jgi:hypothetical protein
MTATAFKPVTFFEQPFQRGIVRRAKTRERPLGHANAPWGSRLAMAAPRAAAPGFGRWRAVFRKRPKINWL